jgi:hypothetical protein
MSAANVSAIIASMGSDDDACLRWVIVEDCSEDIGCEGGRSSVVVSGSFCIVPPIWILLHQKEEHILIYAHLFLSVQ